MQPHSMAVQTLAGYAWNRFKIPDVKNAQIKVSFKRHDGTNRVLRYRVYVTKLTTKELSAKIIRQKGGIDCRITIVRNSDTEGFECQATHSQQHVSGLVEVSKHWKENVKDGSHRNSLRYRYFSGTSLTPDRKRWRFDSEMIDDKKQFRTVSYTVEIENISLGSRVKNI